MSDKKIYINRDDIYTGSDDPNGSVRAKFKGQLYIDSQNRYYIAQEAGTTVWHYLLTSVDKIDINQILNTLNTKIDSVDTSITDDDKTMLNFYANTELVTSVPLEVGSANAFDGITTKTDSNGNKIIEFSSKGEVVHTVNLGRIDDKFDGALISTNEAESEYYLE